MVEDEGAFMLVGGGGADQITACAQYASENGIPYLSAGVNEEGLADLETYFATTLTYAAQAPLLMEQLQERGITEFGLVVADTPSFDGFVEAVKAAAEEAGITIGYETRITKTAAEPEQLSVMQALKDSGVRGRGPATPRPSSSSGWPTRVSTRATRRSGWARASPAASTPSPTSAAPPWRPGCSSPPRPTST